MVHQGPEAKRIENRTSLERDLSLGSLNFDLALFGRYMRRLGRADSTINHYSANVRRFFKHLNLRDAEIREPDQVRPEEVGWFVDHLIESHPPTSAIHHLRAIRAFFAILELEGVVEQSPVGEISAPSKTPEPAAVLTMSELGSLLRACRGSRFIDLRDMAIARVFVSTGARRSEVLGLSINPLEYTDGDLDLKHGTVRITGSKGGVIRNCSIDRDTVLAIRRYLRIRRDHRHNTLPDLWLGQKGRFTASGLYRTFTRRAESAGITGFHLHRIRHTFAHEWLKAGGNEGDLMSVLGWRSREMVDYYSSSVAEERAIAAARKIAMSIEI